MCFGSSKSQATPPPAPRTTFEKQPRQVADYSNVDQRKAAVAASTNSQTTQGSTMGKELSSPKTY